MHPKRGNTPQPRKERGNSIIFQSVKPQIDLKQIFAKKMSSTFSDMNDAVKLSLDTIQQNHNLFIESSQEKISNILHQNPIKVNLSKQSQQKISKLQEENIRISNQMKQLTKLLLNESKETKQCLKEMILAIKSLVSQKKEIQIIKQERLDQQHQKISNQNHIQQQPSKPQKNNLNISKDLQELSRSLTSNKMQQRNNPLIIKYTLLNSKEREKQLSHIKKHVTKIFSDVMSVSFNLYHKQNLDFEKVKAYCSENIIGNFIEVANAAHLQLQQLKILESHITQKILPFLITNYPCSQQKQKNTELQKRIFQKDIFNQNKYDIINQSKLNITQSKEQRVLISRIMQLINYLIDLSNSSVLVEGNQMSLFQLFQNDMKGIFEKVQNQLWANNLRYLDEFSRNKIYQNGKEYFQSFSKQGKNIDILYQIDQLITPKMSKKEYKLNENNLQQKYKQNLTQQQQQYKDKVKSYTKYKIGRKISPNVEKYSQEEIKRSQMVIKNESISRIMTKWIQQICDFFQDKTKTAYTNQIIPPRLIGGGDSQNLTNQLRNNIFKGCHSANEGIKQLNEVFKQYYYKLLYDIIQGKNKQVVQILSEFCSITDAKVGNFCNLTEKIYENLMSSFLYQLINYMRVLEIQYQKQFKDKYDKFIPKFLNFKLGDLMRCQFISKEKQVVAVYQYLRLLSDLKPQIFQITRTKNRLHTINKDILINVYYRQKIMIEIQLVIKGQSNFLNYSQKFNHFIYELYRGFFGPISQMCCIWNKFSSKSEIIGKVIDKNNTYTQLSKKIIQSSCKHQSLQEINDDDGNFLANSFCFYCGICGIFKYEISQKHKCDSCSILVCLVCRNKKCLDQGEKAEQLRIRSIQSIPNGKVFIGKNLNVYYKNNQYTKQNMIKLNILGVTYVISFDLSNKGQNLTIMNIQVRLQIKNNSQNEKLSISQFESTYHLSKCQKFRENQQAKIVEQIVSKMWVPKLIKSVSKKKTLSLFLVGVPQVSSEGKSKILKEIFQKEQYIKSMESLQKLIVNEMSIIQFPQNLNKLTKLKSLTLCLLDIQSVQLPKNNLIQKLYLKDNKIKQFSDIKNLKETKNLESFTISKNQLTNFEGMPDLESLVELYAESNKIKTLNKFPKLKKLKLLRVSNNQLTSLQGLPMTLQSLEELQANQNKYQNKDYQILIKQLPQNLRKVRLSI